MSVIYYDDGTPIEKIEMSQIPTLSQNVPGNGLSMELLTEEYGFSVLYMHWLRPCVDYMWFVGHDRDQGQMQAPEEEHVRRFALFRKGAAEEDCENFLERYKETLVAPHFPNVGSPEEAERICSYLRQKLDGIPAYVRLRFEAVCLLLNRLPEELFTAGEKWIDAIPGEQEEPLPVRDGMKFSLHLSLAPRLELVSKTLRNLSGQVCTFTVECGDRKYPVKLPPYGILRGVFADDDCRDIISLKGNISCCDAGRAIVQQGDEKGMKLLYVSRCSKPAEFPVMENFLDAAADEMGGAVILTSRELYSTVNNELFLEKGKNALPIRCYRSGSQWARLFADGRLESNLADGRTIYDIAAVSEDGERGLLIWGREGAWDYRGGLSRQISPEMFCEHMMGRFLDLVECEVARTQLIRLAVRRSGRLEVLRR